MESTTERFPYQAVPVSRSPANIHNPSSIVEQAEDSEAMGLRRPSKSAFVVIAPLPAVGFPNRGTMVSGGERRRSVADADRTVAADWRWSSYSRSPVLKLESFAGPGAPAARVWDPSDDTTKLLPVEGLVAVGDAPPLSPSGAVAAATSARIADAIARNVLLAPLDAPVIPLPHQITALYRAVARDPVRLLLADEVGLGKTIEAGLIIRELKLRGRVRRVLVVAPKGLVGQWVAEMRTHFAESFELLLPSDQAARGADRQAEYWRHCDQVVTSLDAVKPLAARQGWSPQQVARYNRDRFEAVVAAGWDLVVVDEAHRLAGATDDVARYKLGRALADVAPHLLLLSATPHNGKGDAFHRLMALLDDRQFPAPSAVVRERVLPYVARTEKRRAVDVEGRPLFRPRLTKLIPVAWEGRHAAEEDLYEAVTEYVRESYNLALRERRFAVGFLLVLFQRLATSSTRAIRAALERRLSALGEETAPEPELLEDDEAEPVERTLTRTVPLSANERRDVQRLLDLAHQSERAGSDAKARRLLALLVELEREELDPQLKLLVFTEFTATQEMLADFFGAHGYSVATLNGSMDLEERRRVQQQFAADTRVLVSTEAGGEGLNLQFCHLVVNYDLPWNPMRIEQRIGRVDRIGQSRPVRAFNLTLEAGVEYRVQEVLQEKLRVILDDLGVDKLGDVLDSGDVEADFARLYVESLLHPERLEFEAAALAQGLRRRADDTVSGAAMLRAEAPPDPAAARAAVEHPLPRWVEALTLGAIRDEGGTVTARLHGFDLTWADGERWEHVTFARAGLAAGADRLVTLSEPRLQTVRRRGRRYVAGQPVSNLSVSGLVAGVSGLWSIWQLSATADHRRYRRLFPLFLHDNGTLLVPSARRIWELLAEPGTRSEALGVTDAGAVARSWEQLRRAAEAEAAARFHELVSEHRTWLMQKREHHPEQPNAEERRADTALAARDALLTEVTPAILIHVEPRNA